MNQFNVVFFLLLVVVLGVELAVDIDAAKPRFVPSTLQVGTSSTGLTVLGVNYPSIQDKFDTTTGLGITNSGLSTLGVVDKALTHEDLVLDTAVDLSKVFGVPELIGSALPFPNPMKFSDGQGIMYYRLSRDMDIEFRLYDGTSSMIYHTFYNAGSTGGKQGKNPIPFTRNELGVDLSAGLYFYMVLYQGEVVSKGKLAVIP